MAAWYGSSTHYWLMLLLLLLLPTLLLAQDDCTHNCTNEANRYYYVRPEGSAETLCPAQSCLTPSQLRDHFSECERKNSCKTASISLVLLPGNYTSASNHGSLIPSLKFLSLTGYSEDCNTDSLATPSIDCNGTWLSLMFQHIKCLHVQNCVVFTGNDTDVEVDRVTFRDSLIRLATTAAVDHSELDYNYTIGSQSYCLLQKQLADISVFTNTISNSLLALRNVSFSSDYHTACTREYGIQLATIHATDSALDIADCLFTQNAVTHISLLRSTLRTSGVVQFENANTALIVNNSSIALAGAVYFSNNNNSAIHAVATAGTHSTILLSGTVEFTNNTAHSTGGAVSLTGGSMTIAENASVVFQNNQAKNNGGAIYSNQHVTIAGSVQFINNSAIQGGAIDVNGNVTIVDNAQVLFQGNHAIQLGGAIVSNQHVAIAGSVQFINNSAYNGGAIASIGRVTIADNAQVHFQGNNAKIIGGAIVSNEHVTIAGSVQFINNSAYDGGAIVSDGNVTITNNTQVFFQGNHAIQLGGAIASHQHVTIAGSVQFINNGADQGGAIDSDDNVTIVDNAQVFFQGNYAKIFGGAIDSSQHVTIAGSVQFINNSASQGGAIHSDGNMTTAENAQTLFQNNNAKLIGGAIASNQHVTIAGSVQFINNSAIQGGAIDSDSSVTTADNAQVVFQGNHAATVGGAIDSGLHVAIAGSVQFINNSASQGGAISSVGGNATTADNAQVLFQGNHAIQLGGAIYSSQHVTIAGSVQLINNSAYQGGAIDANGNVTIVDNAQVFFQGNRAENISGAISSQQHVTIAGSVQFINNSAYQGGAIDSEATMTIANNAQVVFQDNRAENIGGAINSKQHVTIAGSVQFIDNNSYEGGVNASAGDVTINNTVFQGNNAKNLDGANASIQYVTSVQFINNRANQAGAINCDASITIADNTQVLFQGNHAIIGGSIVFGATTTDDYLTIAGVVQFINNSALLGGAILSSENVIIADNAQVVFQGNHADSAGGAILIKSSNVALGGSVQFISNTAPLGGAIAMFPGNKMTVASNAQVVFQGNHAYYVGGAIYSSAGVSLSLYAPQYKFIFKNVCLIAFGINSKMDLLHNTAERGGSAMYGITMLPDCEFQINNQDPEYEYLFDVITINPDSLSAISSEPLRVCVCPDQSTPDCLAILPDQNIPHLHYTVYPGQNFTIPAAVVGFNFALTSGSVYAQFLSLASLGSDSQYVQGVNQTGCSQLQYSVLSDKKQETLVLTTDGRQITDIDSSTEKAIRKQNANQFGWHVYNLPNPQKYYRNSTFITNLTDSVFRLAGYVQQAIQTTPVYISFQMLDCPPGFRLTDEQRCDCNDRILLNHLTCNIIDQTVRRHGNIWVNATFRGNRSNGVIVHKHCPFEYCKPEQLDVNLTHPETQCAFDRFGTLCGACKPNFSLALGGSQCLPNCSNKYLLLLVVFILAGFALVFFIKILNFTVSQGTINGLIFYANIIAANRSIFFPAQHNNFVSFLSVFISWLNLDLGIETCFIEGLDGYWKTWLQFVFPFYVWLIAGAIILASHYSTRATKIFGDKSVSILATLFLLSYAKLLRSIIIIFSFTTLEYPDNVKGSVWPFDGNLQYFGVKHIPLFLFALITLLLLWLPYTTVLLSAQWLRTQTHRKRLRWLKPFLDAYYGPFKDKHHYWVGVLLVVRGVLFVFFASFIAIENNVNLLLISITSVSIPIYTSFTKRLYRKMYVTVLENLLFLNLAVLGIGTFYIRLVGGNQEALVTASVGIAFLEFCGITFFHSYQFVIIPIRQWYAKVRANDRHIDNAVQLQPLLNSDDDSVDYMPRNEVTHSEIRLSQLREEDPPNPTTSAEHQLPPADRINTRHSEEILILFKCGTPQPPTHQPDHSDQDRARRKEPKILNPCDHDTPRVNIHPTKLPSDGTTNETAGAPSQSEAAAVSLDQPPPLPLPPPQESSDQPRYFAAEREERFIDFNAPRETLLEYTQYRLPQERNEPARDSTAERELLSTPHEHPQESSGPRYFAAEREGSIDFTAARESLLDYTQ